MKKTELRKIIREEIQRLTESPKKRYVYGSETEMPSRYEFHVNDFRVDVSASEPQGRPGSNMVVIMSPMDEYVLGTPKMFKTIKEAEKFAKSAIPKIKSGKVGKRVPVEF